MIIKVCKLCKKEFTARRQDTVYCSMECTKKGYSKFRVGQDNPNFSGKLREQYCLYCGKSIFSYESQGTKYCSRKCHDNARKEETERKLKERVDLSLKKKRELPKGLFKRICKTCGAEFIGKKHSTYCGSQCWTRVPSGLPNERTCVVCGKEFNVFPSKIQKACSKECQRKLKSNNQVGEKSHRWQGGKTQQTAIERKNLDYKIWRETVFARDNFTCALCGAIGGKLAAHHIKPFRKFRELKTDVNNGITLCWKCHGKILFREEAYEKWFTNIVNLHRARTGAGGSRAG